MKTETNEIRLKGSPICSGIAIGVPFVYTCPQEIVHQQTLPEDQIEGELARYREALSVTAKEVGDLREQLEQEGLVEGAQILESHLQILSDPTLTADLEKKIEQSCHNAEYVLHTTVEDLADQFERLTDPYFRERSKDLRDLSSRLMSHLRMQTRHSLAEVPQKSVVFAQDLTPSDTAEAHVEQIQAFVTRTGGDTSHAAIMAKAKGIPYVARVDFTGMERLDGSPVIVDGGSGEVILNPSAETLSKYREQQKELARYWERFQQESHLPAQTFDGHQVGVSANIEMFHEIEKLSAYKDVGVGLFRSEYLCLAGQAFPEEEEQYHMYKRLAEAMEGRSVVIRTFDIGGDKFRELGLAEKEDNPFLGCRAIRLMLRMPEVFKKQLRAILRASAYGPVKILFPMVSGLAELQEAKALVEEAKNELRAEGKPFDEQIPIGSMIEVPSAAVTCDVIARASDFLSIGTNDLVQYSLAVDRDNQAMSYLYSPAHPSVLRLIKMVVTEGDRNNISVSLCGEMAADPRFTPLLLGLGVHEFSVASRYVPIVKSAIRRTSIVEASRLAEHILTLPTAIEVLDALMQKH